MTSTTTAPGPRGMFLRPADTTARWRAAWLLSYGWVAAYRRKPSSVPRFRWTMGVLRLLSLGGVGMGLATLKAVIDARVDLATVALATPLVIVPILMALYLPEMIAVILAGYFRAKTPGDAFQIVYAEDGAKRAAATVTRPGPIARLRGQERWLAGNLITNDPTAGLALTSVATTITAWADANRVPLRAQASSKGLRRLYERRGGFVTSGRWLVREPGHQTSNPTTSLDPAAPSPRPVTRWRRECRGPRRP